MGRWQPFHKGHKELVQTALNRGKNACIAIRDTKISKDNPYTVKERKKMIHKAFTTEERKRITVITIPDIDEICYGRNVGYEIKKISLDQRTESISGTKIRNGDTYGNLDHRQHRSRQDDAGE